MSTLTDLLRQVAEHNSQLAADLSVEVSAMQSRRAFGLNFERHAPETVELPGRPIRRGDKVRFLPERGAAANSVDQGLWKVAAIRKTDGGREADLLRPGKEDAAPETASRNANDLVVVAEFRDPIYPGLVSTGKVEHGGDKPYHSVINAENFHALQALLYTHEGKVDAIYIDPPYNTGAKDWKYNNDYVDGEDAYRHSKWLAFMERRLKLAKRLLNPEGAVLIVTIDEKEYLRLGLLIEQVFPAEDIQMVSSVISPKGSARRGSFSRCDEYLFFVMLGDAQVVPSSNDMLRVNKPTSSTVRWKGLLRSAGNGLRTARPNLFYPLVFDAHSGNFLRVGNTLPIEQNREEIQVPSGETIMWPLGNDGRELTWSLGRETFLRNREKGYVKYGPNSSHGRTPYYLTTGQIHDIESETGTLKIVGKDADGALQLEFGESGRLSQPMTVWNQVAHSATEYGTGLLKALLPAQKFPFPKSLYAVEDSLRFFVGKNQNATIVDFFAGSGTTAHAVMRLNKQDSGCRQCISVTNNEVSADEQAGLREKGLRPGDPEWEQWGICDYITKPRLKAAITGNTPDGEPIKGDYKFTDEFPMADGFEENVEFFTMTYESPRRIAHHRSFPAIAPLLWLKAGAQGRRIEQANDNFDVADTYGVLFNPDYTKAFVAALAKQDGIHMAFVVTDDDRAYQSVCKTLPSDVEPVRLYASYLTSFTINTGKE